MKWHRSLWAAGAALALAWAGQLLAGGDAPRAQGEALRLTADQAEFLTSEPVLVTARLEGRDGAALRADPGDCKGKSLHFEITPAVAPRPVARPLPVEAQADGEPVTVRIFDLLEWYEFPAQGSWTVRLAVGNNGTTYKSAPLRITIRRPARQDSEHGPVDRLHHLPWSNYATDAFCGDCFDLVKNWPGSRLARYAHYWNGVYHQHRKEYDKAIASYRAAAEFPRFALAGHAEYGIIECLAAQRQNAAAVDLCAELIRKLEERDGRAAVSAARLLAEQTAQRLLREAGEQIDPQ